MPRANHITPHDIANAAIRFRHAVAEHEHHYIAAETGEEFTEEIADGQDMEREQSSLFALIDRYEEWKATQR